MQLIHKIRVLRNNIAIKMAAIFKNKSLKLLNNHKPLSASPNMIYNYLTR